MSYILWRTPDSDKVEFDGERGRVIGVAVENSAPVGTCHILAGTQVAVYAAGGKLG